MTGFLTHWLFKDKSRTLRIPRPIQYVAYTLGMPSFCAFSWACLMEVTARMYGKPSPVFSGPSWMEKLLFVAFCVFPFTTFQVAVASITVKALPFKVLTWLTVAFTVIGQMICFAIVYQTEDHEALSTVIGFPLSLILPVAILVVAQWLRSWDRSDPMVSE